MVCTHACSVAIHVYNSEQSLEPLIQQLRENLPQFSAEYEIVLVNDGSHDRSWAKICELAEKHSRINAINLMRNYDRHKALLCRIRAAKLDSSSTMDDNLQGPPGEIPRAGSV